MTEIIVYSTPVCPWCHKLKEYLDEKKIKYNDVDVSSDHEAAKKMVEKSGQMGVPQIEINSKIIVGFNKEAIDAELDKMPKEE